MKVPVFLVSTDTD